MDKIKGKHIVAQSNHYLPQHGIGVSKDEVVYSIRLSTDTLETKIVISSINEFLRGRQLLKIEYPSLTNSKDVVINNAVNSIGIQPGDQDVLGDNFAYWCMTGNHVPIDSQIFGQHLRVNRGIYFHHGIGIDGNLVVHYGDPSGGTSKTNAIIHLNSFDEFAKNGFVEIVNYNNSYNPIITRNRAIASIGQNGYDLTSSNCEHFSTWCATGVKHSEQVRTIEKSLSKGAKIIGAGLVLGAFLGLLEE